MRKMLLAVFLLLSANLSSATEPDQAAHEALRGLLQGMEKALANKTCRSRNQIHKGINRRTLTKVHGEGVPNASKSIAPCSSNASGDDENYDDCHAARHE